MECICYEHKKCSFLLKQKELWYTNKERMMEMAKLVFLKEDVYENFVKQHPKSHFLQSYAWGEFAKVKKHLTPYYLGLIDDNKNILGTALLLQKHLPMNYCYFYCPRGYVINYEDENLVTEMTKKIVQFAKSKKAIFIKIDPDLIYKDYNYLEEEQTLPYDTNKIFELANIDCKVNPVSTEKYIEIMNIKQAKRPENSQLCKDKILSQGITIPTWEDGLKRYLQVELNKEQ